MSKLDPRKLFRRLATDIPKRLHTHTFIVGSLAAAYHFRAQLEGRAVNTKDADIVVHPAGDIKSSRAMATYLLRKGWVRTEQTYPRARREPTSTLRAIRLYPKSGHDYFIELLGLPKTGQSDRLVWTPIRLPDGWYGVPCHRFMRLAAHRRLRSSVGLEYASPSMMALANLLSHSTIGTQRMSSPIEGREILRSAKDLGRALALVWLAGRDETESWLESWVNALRECFPRSWKSLCRQAGSGLKELLEDSVALEEAHFTTVVGLLAGRRVSQDNLRAVGGQLQRDLLAPLIVLARTSRATERD